MTPVLPLHSVTVAILASIAGIAVFWLMGTPFGLLAPISALSFHARGRGLVALNTVLLIAFAGSLLAASVYADGAHDFALLCAAFLAVALCIGTIVAAGASAPSDAEAAHAMRIIESMPAYTWSASGDGRFTHVSASTLAYVGQRVDGPGLFHPLDHAGWRRALHPDDYERALDRRRQSLKTGAHYDAEYRLRRWDGTYRWFRSFGSASRDSDGRVLGWYGTMIDIEEEKQAEAALQDRERELSQLVDMVPSHLWRLAPDGQPIFFSKRMVDFLGRAIADICTSGEGRLEAFVDSAIHPDDAVAFRDAIGHCLATGESFELRYRLRRDDGVYRWMSSRAEPMRTPDGRIVQWYGLCHDIDDQVHAEEALRRSERQLQQMIDAVPALVWCTAPDGTPSYINKRLVGAVGVTLGDLTAPGAPRSLADVHPDHQRAVEQALVRSFETGAAFAMTYRQRRSDGAYRWTEGRAEPLRDEAGRIVQWYGVCVDVDDLVTTQAALLDRERELSQLVDLVPSYLWRLTPEGEPNFFNKRLIDFFGADVVAIGQPDTSRLAAIIDSVVHPDDAAALAEQLKRSLESGDGFSMRYRLRRADGVYRWVEGRAEPMRDQVGRIVQWYGLSNDIDDQLRAEEALRESERSLRQLVETLPALIFCAAPDGEPIYRSRQLRDFLGFGLEAKDEPGRARLTGTLDAIIHPDDRAAVLQAYGHSLATGEPYARTHRLRRSDGEYRWVETRAVAMRNAEGAIVQWNGVCFDIEDQVRAQEQLRLAQENLAQASQAASLAELSASIAHEVNQPLAAIVANSHACQRWLSADPPNMERAQKTVERVIRDANAAADIVSRIRALFRHAVETRSCATLAGIVAAARDLLAEEASRRRVRVVIEVDGKLPAVALDPVQLQQVLVNLMRNGMEAMESIAGERTLRIHLRRAGEEVRTEIRDCGPGVGSPDRIFEPFYTTKGQGMGMGLAICRSIVEAHGGRLWAERSEGIGATFVFTLPVEAEVAA